MDSCATDVCHDCANLGFTIVLPDIHQEYEWDYRIHHCKSMHPEMELWCH